MSWRDYALSVGGGFLAALVVLWLTSCTPAAQARRAKVEAAEDAFCAARAEQKAKQAK